MIGVYARVSTDEQNVDQQLAVLKEYCKKNNLQYRSFSDFAISREQDERVGWNKIIKGVEEKEFDSILVQRLDRITGNLKYGVWFWDWMEQHKVKVFTLYEGIYSWDSGDNYFTFMLKILLSQKEMKDLRYRSRIGIERAKKEGKYKGGKVGRKSWAKKKDALEVFEDLKSNLTSEEKPDI
jgi:DNA invertase Pin-like site-specific DNA recombinase